ncbi:MAG: hypothetical protein HOP24_10980 [Sideroxydans sp.]|nr:hypothetical protein [Sideroxydans sp.]
MAPIDALVFTGGIGEHSAIIRDKICSTLAFMGIKLDTAANKANSTYVEALGSKPICIIPADEEHMIQQLCLHL